MVMVTGDDPVHGIHLLKDYIVHTYVKDSIRHQAVDPRDVYGAVGYQQLDHQRITEIIGSGNIVLFCCVNPSGIPNRRERTMERKLETLVISRLTNQTDVSDTDEVQIIKQYQWLKGYNPVVTARLNYSQEDLKLQFKVYEKNPIRTYRNMNDPVYKDSCIEFFFQPTPDSDQRYMNFEFNANGAILLQIGADRYDRFPITINPALFHILSTTDQINDKGEVYWELSFSISWVWVQSYFSDFRAVPGKRIRGNFYKCGDDTTYPHYGTWSEVHSNKPEFHSSCDFGILYLE